LIPCHCMCQEPWVKRAHHLGLGQLCVSKVSQRSSPSRTSLARGFSTQWRDTSRSRPSQNHHRKNPLSPLVDARFLVCQSAASRFNRHNQHLLHPLIGLHRQSGHFLRTERTGNLERRTSVLVLDTCDHEAPPDGSCCFPGDHGCHPQHLKVCTSSRVPWVNPDRWSPRQPVRHR